MNYRHFDFPNSQQKRDARPAAGGVAASLVAMSLMVLLALAVVVILLSLLSRARPTATLPPNDLSSRGAAAVPEWPAGEDTAVNAWAARLQQGAQSRLAAAQRVADALTAYEHQHGALPGLEPGRVYGLRSTVATADGEERPLYEALALTASTANVPGLAVVVQPEGEWVVEVVQPHQDGQVAAYRVHRDGEEGPDSRE